MALDHSRLKTLQRLIRGFQDAQDTQSACKLLLARQSSGAGKFARHEEGDGRAQTLQVQRVNGMSVSRSQQRAGQLHDRQHRTRR